MARSRSYWKKVSDGVMGDHGTMPGVSSDAITSSGAVKDSEGLFLGMSVVSTDSGGDQDVKIYDDPDSADGVILARVSNPTATAGSQQDLFPGFPIHAETGIYCDITGDASVIVYYK
jgi:hypothetical protein